MPASKSILFTRSIDEPLVQKAAKKGLQIDSITFITTEPSTSSDVAEQVQAYAQQSIVAVFTSVHAVEAVITQFPKKPDWKIFCIGGMTRELVFSFFNESQIIGTAKNASALSEKIIGNHHVREVVFFCGDQRLDDLPNTLRASEIVVNELIVYNTIQTPQVIEKDYTGIAFFSPSAVHSFFSLNTIRTDVTLFSIGKTTTATIQTYCANRVITSEWPGREQMVELLIRELGEDEEA